MRQATLKFRALSAAFAWALVVAVASADDSTWTSQQDCFSIALPNANWSRTDAPVASAKWAAANRAKTKSVFVAVFDETDKGDSISLGARFETGFLKSGHATEVKKGQVVLDRRTAYRFVAEAAAAGKKLSFVVAYVVTDGRDYAICATSLVSDADTDKELNDTIDSFRFLDPPSPPVVASTNDPVWTSQEYRCSIALPNATWSQQKPPNAKLKFVALNEDHTKYIALGVFDVQGVTEFSNPEFKKGFEESFLKSANGTKVKEGEFAIDGRMGYRLVADSSVDGKKFSHVVVGVIANGRAYTFDGQSLVGNADTDPEINASINSFHLFDPVGPPTTVNAAPPENKDPAERMGELAFRCVAFLLAGFLVVCFIVRKAFGR